MIRHITLIIIVATMIIWLGWDFIAFWLGGNPATESANIDYFGYQYPSIPLFWGYLTGHFFAEKRLPSNQVVGVPFFQRKDSLLLLAVSVVWGVGDLIHTTYLTQWIQLIPGPGHGAIEMVILGTFLGYKYFQMDDKVIY